MSEKRGLRDDVMVAPIEGGVPSGQAAADLKVKRKKRHTYGVYPCDYPECSKVFQRSDHLSRHRLTHDSASKTFKCPWDGCDKKFNRSDTMKLHYNRHTKLSNSEDQSKENTGSSTATTPVRMVTPKDPAAVANPSMASKITSLLGSNFQLINPEVGNYALPPPLESFNLIPKDHEISPPTPSLVSKLLPESMLQPSDILNFLFPEQIQTPTNNNDNLLGKYSDYSDSNKPNHLSNQISPSNIEQHFHNLFDPSQNMIFDKLNNFPMIAGNLETSIAAQTHIDEQIIEKMIILIPDLAFNADFHVMLLRRCLEIFWSLYNCRASVIHKPSFESRKASPILLLAMVMMGAALTRATDQIESHFTDPQKLARDIAGPLRWVIFQSPELSTLKPWIIQSLIILETYEKHLSTREFFQRSTIHHATKVQILRRSTTLGGDPYRKDNFEAEALWAKTNKSTHLWHKWIELESMKRSAYVTFVMDSFNAVLTFQTILLYAHQLKLSLPCDEQLWLNLNFNQNFLKDFEIKRQSYVSAFIEMVNERELDDYEPVLVILLSGIITLIFLFQNTTAVKLPNSGVNDTWRNMLTYSLESWLIHVRKGCCHMINIDKTVANNAELNATSKYLNSNDHRCKVPVYHMLQVVLRLSNYDWITFAGAPLLMNVRADCTDFETVCHRIQRWCNSDDGAIGVTNAYILLIECFLPSELDDPATFESYQPEKDLLFERPHCLAQLAIITWCFNFALKGPESGFLDNEVNYTYYLNNLSSIDSHVKEDGYTYLKKIQDLFKAQDAKFDKLNMAEYNTPSLQTKLYHRRIKLYAQALTLLPTSHHMAGFMAMVSDMYSKCKDLELCLELSRLMKHCQSRSMGNKEIKCMNMYMSN